MSVAKPILTRQEIIVHYLVFIEIVMFVDSFIENWETVERS